MATYTTFSGQKKDFFELDHQHLSNVYWYNKIVIERDEWFLDTILKRINDKFNGEILPYRPHPDFKSEVDALEDMKYLFWQDTEKTIAKIIYEGIEVGIYKSKNFIRDEKINQIIEM